MTSSNAPKFSTARSGLAVAIVALATVTAGVLLAADPSPNGSVVGTSAPTGDERMKSAQSAMASGEYRRAISLYTDLLQGEGAEPSFLAAVYRERGLANQMAKNPSAAIADYTNAIWLNASPPELQAKAYVGRGLAYLSLSQLTQSVREFDQAVKLAPGLSEAYFGRATAKRLSGTADQASIDYTKALELGSATPELVYYGRGLAYEAMGQKASAVADFKDSLARQPGFAPAKERLAGLNSGPTPVNQQPSEPNAVVASAEPLGQSAPGPAAERSGIEGGPGEGGMARTAAIPPVDPGAAAKALPAANGHSDADEPTSSISPVATGGPTPLPGAKVPPANAPLMSVALRPSSDGVLSSPASPSPSAPAAQTASASAGLPKAEPAPKVASLEKVAMGSPASTQIKDGFFVQLASYGSRQTASTAKSAFSQRFHDLTVAAQADIAEANVTGKGTFYRLRVGPYADRAAAGDVCSLLKKRGQTCVVVTAK